MEKSREQENPSVIVGRNAVLEALRSGRGIECLYVQRPPFTGSLGRIVGIARQKRLLVKEAGKDPSCEFVFIPWAARST